MFPVCKNLPESKCSVCGVGIPFAHKGSPWHGLACGKDCWSRIEFRYALEIVGGIWDPQKEEEFVKGERW